MANKLKQHRLTRDLHIDQVESIYTISQQAIHDKTLHSRFKMRCTNIDEVYNEFENVHFSIISILATIEEANLAEEKFIRDNFHEKYYAVKATYHDLFESVDKNISNLNDASVNLNSNSRNSNIKLPKITLPSFDGTYSNWPTFIELFNSLVHNNTGLTDIEKFQYLVSSLTKEPLVIVKTIPLTNDNYLIAYRALNDRYQNLRLLTNVYWSQIMNAPKIMNESASALRKLLDIFSENLAALKSLNLPVDSWDFVLFNILIQKLDMSTVKRFELQEASTDIPSYINLKFFLERQCSALESVALTSLKSSQQTSPSTHNKGNANTNKLRNNHSFVLNTTNNQMVLSDDQSISCIFCHSPHLIYKCPSFLKKTPFERYQYVKQKNWCTNCLHSAHRVNLCGSQFRCRLCNAKHHTLLHFSPSNLGSNTQNTSDSPNSSSQANTSSSPSNVTNTILHSHINSISNAIASTTTVLLSTAVVEILDSRGNFQPIRVLLDSCSQANVITKRCVNRLGLPRSGDSVPLFGLGEMSTSASGIVNCTVRPRDQITPTFNFDAVVMHNVCSDMPSVSLSPQYWKNISNLKLADPNFHIQGPIDILIGADIFSMILKDGRVLGDGTEPSAINTAFGWILMGKVQGGTPHKLYSFHISCESTLNSTLKRFWELEEVPIIQAVSPDDALCEVLYTKNMSRDSSGRYTVALPFRDQAPSFTDSRSIALRRFLALERRLLKDPQLYLSYSEVLKEYLTCGHMEEISPDHSNLNSSYYIPHHCVLKPASTTTKLRVVFDASAKDAQGLSLNDTLLTGPKLQKDICTVLLHFRIHQYVFTTDIKQMFRQILIEPRHRNYQRILWRFSPNSPIQDYSLNTVTFGVSSSPYLALRTIIQLAEDEKDNFPFASKVLATDIFVDDIVTGCSTLAEGKELQHQLISLLQKGGFQLRKWASNNSSLLENIPFSDRHEVLSFDSEIDSIKILGLEWNPRIDSFFYSVNLVDRACTKRTILSELAKIFDPLGFLSPLTFFAKYLIQYMWSIGLDWDENPPSNLSSKWSQYKKELPAISNISIPRYLSQKNYSYCELHGFSDSSEKGFAAVIYFRFTSSNNIHISLICAKSKVAPLKRISLPRLELCAAVLLSNLIDYVLKAFSDKLQIDKVFAWSDSTVALSWIRSSPHRWKTFVSNRVGHIQERVPSSCWYHVSSEDNPADCASRGLLPYELAAFSLWWAGPSWLKSPHDQWPISTDGEPSPSTAMQEEKRLTLVTFHSLDSLDMLLVKYSSLEKIKRIISYCLRFIHNVKFSNTRKYGPFSIQELHQSLMVLVKRVQHITFHSEIDNLEKRKYVSKPLRKLNPFIGEDGVLRVGGRLTLSGLSYDRKFPALLPRKHRLTDLIIAEVHKANFHPGLQTLQFLLSQHFWILSPRRAIRQCLNKCLRCFRINPVSLQPTMGNLPSFRINRVKAFSIVGVDYGGPFLITLSKHRGVKSQKAYLCLFVCAVTKAIHLELASDLTSDAFLAALRRFIARRGRCSKIFSDQGSNFIGAYNELTQYMQQAAAGEKIEWHFNPPSAPHFGGLFEAGIKSAKSFLLRVVGNQILTYEELYTVLCQIESVLNSRPLCPLSSDPNDLAVLTPGHFLTLEPLTSLPDPNMTDLPLNHLNRWQLIQRLHQDFWKRWHRDYLNTLQQRNKWTDQSNSLSVDSLVLIKNENTPPLTWKLGRVVKLHPGQDDVVRVATVRTSQGLLQRPLVKLCPLPVGSN